MSRYFISNCGHSVLFSIPMIWLISSAGKLVPEYIEILLNRGNERIVVSKS